MLHLTHLPRAARHDAATLADFAPVCPKPLVFNRKIHKKSEKTPEPEKPAQIAENLRKSDENGPKINDNRPIWTEKPKKKAEKPAWDTSVPPKATFPLRRAVSSLRIPSKAEKRKNAVSKAPKTRIVEFDTGSATATVRVCAPSHATYIGRRSLMPVYRCAADTVKIPISEAKKRSENGNFSAPECKIVPFSAEFSTFSAESSTFLAENGEISAKNGDFLPKNGESREKIVDSLLNRLIRAEALEIARQNTPESPILRDPFAKLLQNGEFSPQNRHFSAENGRFSSEKRRFSAENSEIRPPRIVGPPIFSESDAGSVWGSESDDFGSLCASFSRENAPNSPIFSRKTAKNTPKSAKNGPKTPKMTQNASKIAKNASKTTQKAPKSAKMGKNSADFLDLAIENGSAHHKIPVFRAISAEILAAKGEFEAFLRSAQKLHTATHHRLAATATAALLTALLNDISAEIDSNCWGFAENMLKNEFNH
eukprot:TRINITY_DN4066_c0_g1_i2.p1 TRINITY_DN4066_c0_g1~~TRINITY_DN4066_c0_g1_i2.p1  ORF type:complete len:482 (-),score=53.38 TRINITY_DN4066_c0_g1_i2:129-1574(-)